METISVNKEQFKKLISDVEVLIEDVENLDSSEDETLKQRIKDIDEGKIKGKTEKELDDYLKNRGVNLD